MCTLCKSFLEPPAKTIHVEVNVLCAALETLRTMFVKLVQVFFCLMSFMSLMFIRC